MEQVGKGTKGKWSRSHERQVGQIAQKGDERKHERQEGQQHRRHRVAVLKDIVGR